VVGVTVCKEKRKCLKESNIALVVM